MNIYIDKVLQEYLRQAILAYLKVYGILPDELRELLDKLDDPFGGDTME